MVFLVNVLSCFVLACFKTCSISFESPQPNIHSTEVWCDCVKACVRPPVCYLGGSVVQHLLPGGIQSVLAISHQALLCHIDHLPGSCVHRDRSLVAQSCLLGLLLCLQRADKTFIAYRRRIMTRTQSGVLLSPITIRSLSSCLCK